MAPVCIKVQMLGNTQISVCCVLGKAEPSPVGPLCCPPGVPPASRPTYSLQPSSPGVRTPSAGRRWVRKAARLPCTPRGEGPGFL